MVSRKGGVWVTLGYKYYYGMHLGICQYPIDAIKQINAEDVVLYDTADITDSGEISIDKPNAFGGERQQGGVVGDVDIEFGDVDQIENAYLQEQLGASIPAYRGVVCAVLKQVYLAAIQKTVRPWKFLISWLDGAACGPNSLDMNPAHIVELILTEPWGLDLDSGDLDTDSFTAAAAQLTTEELGLSFVWLSTTPIAEILTSVLQHIMGVLYTDPETGKFVLNLMRQGDASALELHEGNVLRVENYDRPLLSELVNEVVIKFKNRNDQDQSITLHNPGLIFQMGGVINSREIRYDMVVEQETAQQLAARDLRNLSTPLGILEFIADRDALVLRIGDIITFSWSKYGIDEVRYRVTWIDYGNLQDGEIKIQAIEDFWGVDASTYTDPPDTAWTDPESAAAAAPQRKIYEAPYYVLVQRWGEAAAVWDEIPDDAGWLLAAGQRPSGDATNYQLWTKTTGSYAETDPGSPFCPTGTTGAALIAEAVTSTIDFTAVEDCDLVVPNTYCLIENEVCEVTALDLVAGSITLKRGVLDTVPVAHNSGVYVFFAETWVAEDPTEYYSADTVYAKILPTTPLGTLAIGSAPEDNVVMADRLFRPYPPGNYQLNGEAWPAFITGPVTATWAHRDRLQQTAGYIAQNAGDIGPEVGTTYTIRFYSELAALQKEVTGLATTTYAYTIADEITDAGLPGARPNETMRVVVFSVRDGAASWQSQDFTIAECRGYGMFYGAYYGE